MKKNKKIRVYKVTFKRVLKHLLFCTIGFIMCLYLEYLEGFRFSLKLFLLSSVFWGFHLRLLFEYLLEDFRKKLVIDGDRVSILRGGKVIVINRRKDVKEIIEYRSKDYYKAPFIEFSFVKIKLSNGKSLLLTSISSETDRLWNILCSEESKTVNKFYPSLLFQKIDCWIDNYNQYRKNKK